MLDGVSICNDLRRIVRSYRSYRLALLNRGYVQKWFHESVWDGGRRQKLANAEKLLPRKPAEPD